MEAQIPERLNIWQLFCYGALSMPIAMAGMVLVTFIPTYYAVDLGLGLSIVGAVFVFGRLIDIFTDPLIGYFSDETRSPLGQRRPWMIIGLPFFILSTYLLYHPPEAVTLTYLVIVSCAYFLFYTIVDVPYSSIGLEISPYTHERSVLASVKAIFQVLGALTAAIIPLILVGNMGASLKLSAQLTAILSMIGLILVLLFLPRRHQPTPPQRQTFMKNFKTIMTGQHYRGLLLSFFIVQTANSLTIGLTVLFVTNIIGHPELIGAFLALTLLSSALFLPVWVWLSKKYGKKQAWMSAVLLCCMVLSLAPFLARGDVIPMALFCTLIGTTFGCDAIMPTSILADIVEENKATQKKSAAALYLAFKNSVSKLTFIAPMGLAFPILDWVGFRSGEVNHDLANITLIGFYALLPIALRLIALIIIKQTPLGLAQDGYVRQ